MNCWAELSIKYMFCKETLKSEHFKKMAEEWRLTLEKMNRTGILDQPLPVKSAKSSDLLGEVLSSHGSDGLQ